MKNPGPFTHPQIQELGRIVRSGRSPSCPECAAPLDERAVPPRGDVSYVRDRILLVCPSCHRTAVIDRRDANR